MLNERSYFFELASLKEKEASKESLLNTGLSYFSLKNVEKETLSELVLNLIKYFIDRVEE